MYEHGWGTSVDYERAAELYTEAAEQGRPDAQHNLARFYEFGRGVAQDYKKAVHWFTKAAEAGSAESQTNLGAMYAEGLGVPKDTGTAMQWFTRAAQKGQPVAQFNDRDCGLRRQYYHWFDIDPSREKIFGPDRLAIQIRLSGNG